MRSSAAPGVLVLSEPQLEICSSATRESRRPSAMNFRFRPMPVNATNYESTRSAIPCDRSDSRMQIALRASQFRKLASARGGSAPSHSTKVDGQIRFRTGDSGLGIERMPATCLPPVRHARGQRPLNNSAITPKGQVSRSTANSQRRSRGFPRQSRLERLPWSKSGP